MLNPSTHFGLVASVWKKKDPEFASQMAWMFQQQGSYPSEIGGFSGTLASYRSIVLDTNIVAKAPSYGSELFPKTGVVLRNRYPSDRETMLHMIQGAATTSPAQSGTHAQGRLVDGCGGGPLESVATLTLASTGGR